MRQDFIIDMYDQYANGADQISHIMAEKVETIREREPM